MCVGHRECGPSREKSCLKRRSSSLCCVTCSETCFETGDLIPLCSFPPTLAFICCLPSTVLLSKNSIFIKKRKPPPFRGRVIKCMTTTSCFVQNKLYSTRNCVRNMGPVQMTVHTTTRSTPHDKINQPTVNTKFCRTPRSSTKLVIFFSCFASSQVSVVRWLLEHGADPNHVDKAGYTPLAWACRSGVFPTVEALVEAGADVMHRRPTLPGGR